MPIFTAITFSIVVGLWIGFGCGLECCRCPAGDVDDSVCGSAWEPSGVAICSCLFFSPLPSNGGKEEKDLRFDDGCRWRFFFFHAFPCGW